LNARSSHISPKALHVIDGVPSIPAVNPELTGALKSRRKEKVSINELAQGILEGNISMLSRGITLIESRHPAHRKMAQDLIERCLPYSGNSIRVGITGIPGVGKSTFIEALGTHLADPEHKLAVLAVDPSSGRSGGSILGDKTRMEKLAALPNVFIRPSPSGGSLGGVSRKTRESIILCEAAGYNVIFVETVGVGQSESAVHSMTDFFLLLIIPGAGDELQGMKRGIVELADAILVNKADGQNAIRATQAQADYTTAMHLLPPHQGSWNPQVLTCSSKTLQGISEVWSMIKAYCALTEGNGYFQLRRREQASFWLHDTVAEYLKTDFYNDQEVKKLLHDLTASMDQNQITPFRAAQRLLEVYYHNKKEMF